MPAPEQLTGPWVNIQALPAPAEGMNMPLILFSAAGVVLLLVLLRYFWHRPKFSARRRIRRLHQTADPRQQLFLLHQALQHGLQVQQLQHIKFEGLLQHDWQTFCHELLHLRFQVASPTSTDVMRLTQQARDWLKRV